MSLSAVARVCESKRLESGWLRDAAALSVFVLASAIFFAPELLIGAKLQDDDIFQQSIPVLHWYGQSVQSLGDVLWAPGILGGFPLAFTQYSLISPLDWLLARVLDPDRAYALGVALYLPAAGIFSYLYARVLGLSRSSSLLAGVGYELSTEALALGANGYVTRNLFLLPALLLSAELTHRRGARWALVAAWATGISLLSGQVYIAAIALLNAGIYTLVRAAGLWIKSSRSEALGLLSSMAFAVLAGVAVAAVRVLPTVVVTSESVRSNGLPFATASLGAPDIILLVVGYLLPLTQLVGLGYGLAPPSYVGPIVLVLAATALLQVRKRGMAALLGAFLLFNLLASLGDNGPLFPLLHRLPGISLFRGPTRFTAASTLFLCVLAGWALDQPSSLLRQQRGVRIGLMIAAIAATVGFCLVMAAGWLWLYGGQLGSAIRSFAETNRLGPINPLRPRMALALVAIPGTLWFAHFWWRGNIRNWSIRLIPSAATAALLLVVGSLLIPLQTHTDPFPATARFLQGDQSLFRVLAVNPGMSLYNYLMVFWNNDPKQAGTYTPAQLALRRRYLAEMMAPNLGLQYGVETIDGYEVLQSRRQAVAMAYLGSETAETKDLPQHGTTQKEREDAVELLRIQARPLVDHLPVLRAFNVKYALSSDPLPALADPGSLRDAFDSRIPGLAPGAEIAVHAYEVVGSLPRAYLVPDSITVASEMEALDALLSGRIDPTKTVMLEPPEVNLPAGRRLDPSKSGAEIVSRTNSQLLLKLATDGAGFLVINDAFYPGWEARIDGESVPVQVANGWVKAIPIQSAGEHNVTLVYDPPFFSGGLSLSLGSIALLALAPFLPRFRRALVPGSRWRRRAAPGLPPR